VRGRARGRASARGVVGGEEGVAGVVAGESVGLRDGEGRGGLVSRRGREGGRGVGSYLDDMFSLFHFLKRETERSALTRALFGGLLRTIRVVCR
jgi:hypothetical protein